MSVRKQSTKHSINRYNAFGSNCITSKQGVGELVIWATLVGSYGETTHRIVGGSYWDIDKCLKRAQKYYNEGKYRNIEIGNLQLKWRVPFVTILQQQQSIN